MSASLRSKNHNECYRFFRLRLLNLNQEQIKKLTDEMDAECKSIPVNALQMSWYMRGGVTYNDIMMMSHEEVEAINKIISDNLETTKKTKLPFF